MCQKLRKLLNIFAIFRKKNTLPYTFHSSEKIARTIFSPINITADQKNIRPNAFKSVAGIDEISVNRLSHTTIDFIRDLGKGMTNRNNDREYFGFGILIYFEIIECKADITYTPKDYNSYHSDIKLGYVPIKGKPLPSEYAQKAKNLANKARLYKDPKPESNEWEGGVIN